MDLQLTGRRALVTGSSVGIGEAIAKGLAAEGVFVAIHVGTKIAPRRQIGEP
jgi:3-oxoacyl-[acyl-carrier protein] reductase